MNVTLRRAFITGGSGFVGRNLTAQLKARGDTVRALARSEAAIKTVQQLGAEPVRGDLDNVDALRNGMSGCDVVFHSALLKTQNIDPGNRNVPLWVAQSFARVVEGIWRGFHLNSRPLITRIAVCLIGESVTVNDAKARRELGYVGHVPTETGLAEMV